jgi:hypothetical protein
MLSPYQRRRAAHLGRDTMNAFAMEPTLRRDILRSVAERLRREAGRLTVNQEFALASIEEALTNDAAPVAQTGREDSLASSRWRAIPLYDSAFDEARPATYLSRAELSRLRDEANAFHANVALRLLREAEAWRDRDGDMLYQAWWLDYDYHRRAPKTPLFSGRSNASDCQPIAKAYWDALFSALVERHDRFVEDVNQWLHYRGYEWRLAAWRQSSWWNRTFKQAKPVQPTNSVSKEALLRWHPAEAEIIEEVDRNNGLFNEDDWRRLVKLPYHHRQIACMSEADWDVLFERAFRAAHAAGLDVARGTPFPMPDWQKAAAEARRPMRQDHAFDPNFVRVLRADERFLGERVPAYLRSVLGLPVELRRPTGPFIYASVFLPDIGQSDKPWLYIGKRINRGDDTYLGSGRVLREYIGKFGQDYFQRYIVASLPRDSTDDDLAEAEQGILTRFTAKQDKRLFNLVNT